MKRIIITGARGLLGADIVRFFRVSMKSFLSRGGS